MCGAVRLVEAVGQAARDQRQVGALDAEDELRGGGDVGDRVGDRHVGGHRGARLARSGPPRPGSRPRPRRPGEARAALAEAAARRRRPAGRPRRPRRAPRRRCRGGPRARPRGRRSARARAPSSNRWSAAISPATIAAAEEPRPRASGISLRISNRRPSAGMKRLEGAHAQVRAVVRHRLATRVDRELPRLGDLQLEVEREGSGEDVVARPEVRGRGRNADEAPAVGHVIAST